MDRIDRLEAAILAGGRGERFWPLSRRGRPKQLLRLTGEESLLRSCWSRLRVRLPAERIHVIAASDLREAVLRELPELSAERFLGEPVGRNTAPAVAVAAALALRRGEDPIQLVVPADHWIDEPARFWEDVATAVAVAAAGDAPLVTLGIPITRPETGYGYIERGAARAEAPGAYRVARFHEKPDLETARGYQESGDFYWNSGMFVWRASAVLEELARHMPQLHALVLPLARASDPVSLLPDVFARAQAHSIDNGLLEHSSRVAVVEARFDWTDLGNWSSWAERRVADAAGNTSAGEVVAVDSSDCVLYSQDGLIATLGVRNLVVVKTGDVTLVIDRDRCQDVRGILEAIRAKADLSEYL
ncbi:MAG: sugar phosphate nucleotidyltransferase [Candidatus Eisenbacteria bacterium]